MKKMSKRNVGGFTLIELLVVVLIIGILSAVALPQYQKTVLKSRAAEAWANLNSINKAVNAYCLENPTSSGDYSEIKDVLPVEVDNSNNFSYIGRFSCRDITNPDGGVYVGANYNKGGKSFKLGLGPGGERFCAGNNCGDLGYVKYGFFSNGRCHCGVGTGYCYYMD